MIIISVNNTFINACSGGILVEVSRKITSNNKKLERYNASSIYKNVGNIISSIFRGIVIEIFGAKTIFIMAGGLSLFNVISGLIYFESKSKEENSYQIIKNNINEEENKKDDDINLLTILNNKNILIPLILVLFFSSSPSYFEPAFYYLTDIKKFNPRNFGELTIFMMILMLSVSILYKRYLKSMNKKKNYIMVKYFFFFI